MFRERPAVLFALPFLLGVVLGWHWDFSPWYILGFVALLLVIGVLVAVSSLPFPARPIFFILVPLVCLSGILKISLDKGQAESDRFERFLGRSTPLTVRGTVTDPPTRRGERIQFVVKAREIVLVSVAYPVSSSVLVSVDAGYSGSSSRVDSLEYGRDLEIDGMLAQPGSARNPGEFDLRQYLRVQGIDARCYVETMDRIRITGMSGNWFLSNVIYPLRRAIGRILDVEIGGEEAKLLKGLVIGDRSEMTPEVRASFVNSGVMHVLAVSGLHVVLVLLILEALLSALRFPEKPRTILLCFLLVGYMFLTGSSPSVVRSVIMGIVVLGARFFERRSDVMNSLAVAAVGILLFDARQLFLPGFQLSFVAVFAIVLLYPRLSSLAAKLPAGFRGLPGADAALRLVCVSVAAGIGTLPFIALYFGKIPVIGFLANLVIVPLSSVVLALGMTTVAFSFLSEFLGSLYAEVTKVSTVMLLDAVHWFGTLPFSYFDAPFNGWYVAVSYSVIGSTLLVRRTRHLVLISLFILNVLLYGWIFGASPGLLRVTVLDVGQGDAIVVEFPDRKTLLIDAGPRTFSADAGARFVAPFLRFKRISNVDGVLVTHPHSDHLGGIPFVLRTFPVGQVITSPAVSRSSLFEEFRNFIDSMHLATLVVRSGDRIDGFPGTRLYVLHPSTAFIKEDESDLNNQSVVVRLVYGSTSILLAGDAEEEAEREIAQTYGGFLQSDVLKAGHHGSRTSTSEDFLQTVAPTQAVLSVGRNNKFHHPSPEVLRRLERIRTYRTDEQNAVVLVSDGKRWSVEDWR